MGTHLAREGRLSDAEALLSDAVRLSASPEMKDELARVRRQLNPPHAILVDSLHGHNIVRFDGRFLGIPQAAGQFNVAEVDLSAIPGLVIGDSIERVREAIVSATAMPQDRERREAANASGFGAWGRRALQTWRNLARPAE